MATTSTAIQKRKPPPIPPRIKKKEETPQVTEKPPPIPPRMQKEEEPIHKPQSQQSVKANSREFASAQPATENDLATQSAKKVFYLPCHYAPAFSNSRLSKRVADIQENRGVVFQIVNTAGVATPLTSLHTSGLFISFTEYFTYTSESTIPQAKHLAQFLTASPTTCYRWLWQNDQGGYSVHDPDLNAMMEANYKDEGSFQCKARNGFEYNINFATMTQINVQTRCKRTLKYEVVSIEWQYRNPQGTFVSHTHSNSGAIERIYVAGKPTALVIDGRTFTFDFTNMRQLDSSTSQAYTIRREVLPCSTPVAAYEVTLQVEGMEEKLDAAISELVTGMRAFIRVKKDTIGVGQESGVVSAASPLSSYLSDVKLNRIVHTVLLQKTRLYAVSTLISGHTIELHGIPEYLKDVMLILTKLLFRVQQRSKELLSDPVHWSPQSCDVGIVTLSMGREWNDVQSLVHRTLDVRILAVQRIQNRMIWARYDSEKQRLVKKNQGIINERELFHGTGDTPPTTIIASDHGFDFRYSAAKGLLWGEGAYFAENASYSDKYAYISDKSKQLFLVKVLSGIAYKMEPDNTRTLKKPPANYDTVTGFTEHSGGSNVYVVYDHDKTYPAYLITYTSALSDP